MNALAPPPPPSAVPLHRFAGEDWRGGGRSFISSPVYGEGDHRSVVEGAVTPGSPEFIRVLRGVQFSQISARAVTDHSDRTRSA